MMLTGTPVTRRVSQTMRRAIALVLLAVLAACSSVDPAAEQTAVAMNATLGTEVVNRRMTSTYDADRRMVTQNALETAAALAVRRQGQIKSTLAELDFPTPDVLVITPAALPTRVDALFVSPTFRPMDIASGGITRAAPTPDPSIPTETPIPTLGPETNTPDPTQPRAENVVTSTGVGDDDCAVGTTNTFSTTSGQIYIVANAYNVQRGMTIASRWTRGGEALTTFSFAPDFAINGACIWFFADQSDFAFSAGSYRVEIDINGVMVGATDFTVQ